MNTKKIIKIFILILVFFSSFNFFTSNTQAASWLEKQKGIGDEDSRIGKAFGTTKPASPQLILAHIISISLTFIGVIFLGLTIYAGYKYMTAQGNEDKVKEATDQIRNGVIGVVIVLGAWIIADWITDCALDIGKVSKLWICK